MRIVWRFDTYMRASLVSSGLPAFFFLGSSRTGLDNDLIQLNWYYMSREQFKLSDQETRMINNLNVYNPINLKEYELI